MIQISKVAVVEDEERYRDEVIFAFKEASIEVEGFVDTPSFFGSMIEIEIFEKQPYDLVVLDKQIKCIDVLDRNNVTKKNVIEELRTEYKLKAPIILHSNSWVPNDLIEDGNTVFLQKRNMLTAEYFLSALK